MLLFSAIACAGALLKMALRRSFSPKTPNRSKPTLPPFSNFCACMRDVCSIFCIVLCCSRRDPLISRATLGREYNTDSVTGTNMVTVPQNSGLNSRVCLHYVDNCAVSTTYHGNSETIGDYWNRENNGQVLPTTWSIHVILPGELFRQEM